MADQLGAKAAAPENVADHDGADPDQVDFQADLFTSRDGDRPSTTRPDTDRPDTDRPDGDRSDGDEAEARTGSGDQTSAVPAKSTEDSIPSSNGVATADEPGLMTRLLGRPRGQLRARKVQRIVRRVDPWSVLKVSLLFYFCVWLMAMVSLVLVWGTAMSSGTVGSLESFIAEFLAFEEFKFNGDQLFQIFALGGLIGVFVATAATAVLAVLFNLIADLTGGIRFTVIEEESARRLHRGDVGPH